MIEPPPAVVIEHENDYPYNAKFHDFWKLCLFAAPLRVFIGYCKTRKTQKCKLSD